MRTVSKELTIEVSQSRCNRLYQKVRALNQLPLTLMFITLTLNNERGKDRYNKKTIEDATHRAIKKGKPDYYVMIYEAHKDGAYHSHIIAPILDAQKIVNNYTAGFYKLEEVRSNTYNELVKYLTKSPKGERSIYASDKLNLMIKAEKKTEKRNKTNDYQITQSQIQKGE